MPTTTAGDRRIATISATVARAWPNRYDLIVFIAIGAIFVALVHGAKSMHRPLEGLAANPVSLDPLNLPQYALLTTMRMFAALGFSLLFTFLVAPLAAKSKKAERVIIPALDILQSVPVLGFLTFTVIFFMNLFPGSHLCDFYEPGVEHDVLLLSVAENRSARLGRNHDPSAAFAMAAILEA
jgi:NitT/TauT family transport system permease protein